MNKIKIVLLVAAVFACACAASAQDTNYLRTQIGQFETRTGVVLIKGFAPVGSIPMGTMQLSVGCKQTKDTSTGQKIHGLIIEVEGSQFAGEYSLVDDDEVTPLLDAVNYLAKINNDASPLPGFEASYTSKMGLAIIAESVGKDGGVRPYLRFENLPRIALTPVQMTQFAGLIQQGRKNLDAIKAGKDGP